MKIRSLFSRLTEKKAPLPLARAYAHSDSNKLRPLAGALGKGFESMEVDVWLVKGKLRAGHDLHDLCLGRTLEDTYLKPLAARVRRNNGSVHPGGTQSIQLLIDVKSEPTETYKAVHELLEKYKDILTVFTDDGVQEGAVTAVISGNRDLGAMKAQKERYAAYDGRLKDLDDTATPCTFMPVISASWPAHFTWDGAGPMPAEEREKLSKWVQAAHAEGRRLRFWATPEKKHAHREALWKELLAAGVDYISTDKPSDLAAWLKKNDPKPSTPPIKWFLKPGR